MRGLTGFLLLGIAAWSPQSRAQDCVGVVPGGGGKDFWGVVEAGAHKAGENLDVQVYFRGPAKEGDIQAQLKIIDLIVQRGCKALVIAPVGRQVADSIGALRANNIPVLYVDRDMGGDVDAVIATDSFQAGELAGQQMASVLGGKGRVAVLKLREGVVSTTLREQGFIQAAKAGGLEIVFEQYLEPDSQKTLAALHEALPQVDGLFTPNGTTTLTALAALKRFKNPKKKVFIGFDRGEILQEALQQGWIDGLVVQQPYAMGYQGVLLAHQFLNGETPQSTRRAISIPVRYVTRDNLEQPDIARLMRPLDVTP